MGFAADLPPRSAKPKPVAKGEACHPQKPVPAGGGGYSAAGGAEPSMFSHAGPPPIARIVEHHPVDDPMKVYPMLSPSSDQHPAMTGMDMNNPEGERLRHCLDKPCYQLSKPPASGDQHTAMMGMKYGLPPTSPPGFVDMNNPEGERLRHCLDKPCYQLSKPLASGDQHMAMMG